MSEQKLENKKHEIEFKGRIREFVFGIQDALISTVGLLTGIQKATADSQTVIITGIAAALTGALSMATGSYLSTKSQKEIFEKELQDQKKFVDGEPYLAQEGLLDAMKAEGLSEDNAYRIVRLFAKQKSVFLRTFQEKVLGLGSADISNPVQGAIVMYLSFVVGACFPLAPYLLTDLSAAFPWSVGLSAAALFVVGASKNFMAKKSVLLGGFEFLAVALGSAFLGWAIGSIFEKL